MKLDNEQRRSIEQTDRSLVVTAGAGSGKTTVLVERYIRLVTELKEDRMVGPERIVAITFTEKAAAQMRSRVAESIRKRIDASADEKTNQGLKEILERLPASRISTIDSFCMNIVRHYPMYAGVHPEFAVLEPSEADRFRSECIKQALDEVLDGLDEDARQALVDLIIASSSSLRFFLKQMGPLVKEAYTMRTNKEVGSMPDSNHHLALIRRRAIELFEKRMTEAKALDFSMIEDRALKVLELEAGDEIRSGIDHVLVDEYQDVNTAQDQLVKLLVSRKGQSERQVLESGRLFIVGDPKQSIYRFRGSEPGIFEKWIKEAGPDSRHVRLERNYRSNPMLIDFSNRLFHVVMEDQHQDSQAGRSVSLANGAKLVKVLACPKEEGRSIYTRTADEVLAIAGSVKSCKEGGEARPIGYKDIAILTPSNDGMDPYVDVLRAYGIPVAVMKGGTFYQSTSVAFVASLFGIALNDADDVSAYRLLASPAFAIRDATIALLSRNIGPLSRLFVASGLPCIEAHFKDTQEYDSYIAAKQAVLALRVMRSSCGTRQILERLAEEAGLERHVLNGYGRRGVANYRKLIEIAGNPALMLGNPIEYLDYLVTCREEEVQADEPDILDDDEEAVKVMTIHKAKGLEFPVVILGDGNYDMESSPKWTDMAVLSMKDGAMVGKGSTDKSHEVYEKRKEAYLKENARERRRLIYVAVTRAEEMLIISGCEKSKDVVKSTGKPLRKERYLFAGIDSISQGTGTGSACPTVEWICDMSNPSCARAVQPAQKADLQCQSLTDPMLRRSNDRISRFSPSSLMLFERCRKEFLRKQWYRLPEEELSLGLEEGQRKPEYKASDLGIIVHYIAQHSEATESAEGALRRAEAFFGEKLTKNAELMKRVKELASNYHRFIGQEKPGGRLMKEASFSLSLGDFVLEGLIDRIEEDGSGGWVVTDYKTNNMERSDPETLRSKYDIQLKAYMLAANKALDSERVTARLLFLTTGEVAKSSGPDFKAIEEELVGMMEEASVLPETCRSLSQACEGCKHRQTCPEGFRYEQEQDLYESQEHEESEDMLLE